jgi:hypothetical protein
VAEVRSRRALSRFPPLSRPPNVTFFSGSCNLTGRIEVGLLSGRSRCLITARVAVLEIRKGGAKAPLSEVNLQSKLNDARASIVGRTGSRGVGSNLPKLIGESFRS